jgi:hypothetical protein
MRAYEYLRNISSQHIGRTPNTIFYDLSAYKGIVGARKYKDGKHKEMNLYYFSSKSSPSVS